jgi:hypothetical protein
MLLDIPVFKNYLLERRAFGSVHLRRGHVLKTFGSVLLMACGLAITAAPVRALQIVVTQVDKNTDGSMTYHFVVKTDQGETLTPGESKETSDFVTVYNFYGLIDGSVKSPAGWEFSSEEFGGADRRFHSDYPHERDGVRRIHGASHARVASYQRRRRRNAGRGGFGIQTGSYRLAGDTEFPR